MLKRFLTALLACVAVICAALPAKPDVSSAFAQGSVNGVGQYITLDLGGQSTCRIIVVGGGGFTGTFGAAIESVGGLTFYPTTIFDDNGVPVTTIPSAGGQYTAYPKSAGTIEVGVLTWSGTGAPFISINCSPAGGPPAKRDANGYTAVTFPSAQPVHDASPVQPSPLYTMPVTTSPPQPQVTPLCPVGSYPCGFPTPIPTIAPVPAPTASAGAPPPATAPWDWSLFACQYNTASPAPSNGNVIPCQSNFDGSLLASAPQINSTLAVTANGLYLTSELDGEASCNLKMNPSGTAAATVNVQNSSSVIFAGPYTVSGTTNTATFQLVTPFYVVVDALSVKVTGYTGTGSITITLTCSNAPGVVSAYQGTSPWKDVLTDAGGTPWTAASPFPGPTPIPYQSFAGTILKTVPSDTGGNALPTPATAASPAPSNVPASGITGVSGAAVPWAPIYCNQSVAIAASASAVLVATSGSTAIYVCGFSVEFGGTAAGKINFASGTGTVCATGQVAVTGVYGGVLNAVLASGGPTPILILPPGKALCLIATGGTSPQYQGFLNYTQF